LKQTSETGFASCLKQAKAIHESIVRSFFSWALQLDKPLAAGYKLLLKSFGEGMLDIV
jgi:hypothetical protein